MSMPTLAGASLQEVGNPYGPRDEVGAPHGAPTRFTSLQEVVRGEPVFLHAGWVKERITQEVHWLYTESDMSKKKPFLQEIVSVVIRNAMTADGKKESTVEEIFQATEIIGLQKDAQGHHVRPLTVVTSNADAPDRGDMFQRGENFPGTSLSEETRFFKKQWSTRASFYGRERRLVDLVVVQRGVPEKVLLDPSTTTTESTQAPGTPMEDVRRVKTYVLQEHWVSVASKTHSNGNTFEILPETRYNLNVQIEKLWVAPYLWGPVRSFVTRDRLGEIIPECGKWVRLQFRTLLTTGSEDEAQFQTPVRNATADEDVMTATESFTATPGIRTIETNKRPRVEIVLERFLT